MKTKAFFSKALYVIIALSAISIQAKAQTFVNQVLVVSGGKFGDPDNHIKIGVYKPGTKTYTVFDSVKAKSVRSAIIEGKYAYITADSEILKYDLDNYTKVSQKSYNGFNSPGGYMAVYKQSLLVTRGYDANGNGGVHVYGKDSLEHISSFLEIPLYGGDILVKGDSAYVTVPGEFASDSGSIYIIDLKTNKIAREIHLGKDGDEIGRIFSYENNVYAISSKNSMITKIEPGGAITNAKFMTKIDRGAGLLNGKILLEINENAIGAYNISNYEIDTVPLVTYAELDINSRWSVANTTVDTLTGNGQSMYIAASDFMTYGRVFVLDENYDVVDTFETGISPEAIAIDYRSVNSIYDGQKKSFSLQMYPNPATSITHINIQNLTSGTLTISDMNGRVVFAQKIDNIKSNVFPVDISHFPQGIYNVNMLNSSGLYNSKLIKY